MYETICRLPEVARRGIYGFMMTRLADNDGLCCQLRETRAHAMSKCMVVLIRTEIMARDHSCLCQGVETMLICGIKMTILVDSNGYSRELIKFYAFPAKTQAKKSCILLSYSFCFCLYTVCVSNALLCA